MSGVTLTFIGKSADDLRFFILLDGMHAGGITVHSVRGSSFSYGIAVAPERRRQGVAREALKLLFAHMRSLGFTRAVACVEAGNAASLALHRGLGFETIAADGQTVRLSLTLAPSPSSPPEHTEPTR
ncbi:MAG: GNAT family N-acetyltransferase [Clostridia bacterium]|nr:GNAT family N-acetyltransferase [Clostridia bacterium]